jgi:aminoglycoside phosphotransferase (APT) family kinase protein
LERQSPPAVSPRLIHGDFALDNVLIRDGAVSGIVDWAWGAVGDPRYDLALAIRPKIGVFQTPEDRESFFSGYGTTGLSQEEYEYFVALYEFF